MMNMYVLLNDSVFVGAYEASNKRYQEEYPWVVGYHAATIHKKHKNGEDIWKREYHYFPIADSINEPSYLLKDLQLTPDGGFIMCGEVRNYDTLNTGTGGQYAYFLKVNCLGFLGEPEANASHQIQDNFGVEFYNMSMQAGSYTWHFGDGDSLRTDEYTDTVAHTYPNFGASTGSATKGYEVMLVAHGCNGAADTLRFTVEPALHADPSVVTEGNGYFTIFPNPVLSGNELYVYLNGLDPKNGEVALKFHDLNGKLVHTIPLTAQEGTYFLKNPLANGMYLVTLYQGENPLEKEKLVVE